MPHEYHGPPIIYYIYDARAAKFIFAIAGQMIDTCAPILYIYAMLIFTPADCRMPDFSYLLPPCQLCWLFAITRAAII